MNNKNIPPLGREERIDIDFEKNKSLRYEHLQRYNWAIKKMLGKNIRFGMWDRLRN